MVWWYGLDTITGIHIDVLEDPADKFQESDAKYVVHALDEMKIKRPCVW